MKLLIDYNILKKTKLEQDLDKFNRQPLNFRLSIKIRVQHPFEVQENSNIAKILKGTEYLSVWDSDSYSLNSGRNDHMALEGEEKKRMKFGKKNIVKIMNWSKEEIDVARVLSYCDSLEHLYIRENRNLIKWKSSPVDQEEEIKGFRNLKVVALQFQHLFVDDNSLKVKEGIDDENKESFSRFASTLFVIFSRIEQKCHSLAQVLLNGISNGSKITS